MAANQIGDALSLLGVLISVGGFVVTILKLMKSQRAAEAAEAAAVSMRQSMEYATALGEPQLPASAIKRCGVLPFPWGASAPLWRFFQNIFRHHERCVKRPAQSFKPFCNVDGIAEDREFSMSAAFKDPADDSTYMQAYPTATNRRRAILEALWSFPPYLRFAVVL